MATTEELVRTYYAALDEHAYDDLRGVLDPEFVQERPDRTFEDRESFVAFMRDDRPNADTTHEIDGVIVDDSRVVVEGRLFDSAGEELFRFADVHTVDDERIVHLRTYTQ
ncbi:Ketosteroid isomerase-related protein [Natronoarchaeum philippinense]|uniref:Ketosteroid isomerase-related protein n=2 Tax=Natronoarchaeum philippinense TaxID=558529 RepID=A0A285P4Y3_NATPI|nr:Ketosteroid isomerase-related protein [Natronoarchaeum philippinense]